MGCGAFCGNNSSIYEPNQYFQKIILSIVPQLRQAKQFISIREYQSFLKQINQFPLNYCLKVGEKLVSKEQIDPGILKKWKVILYCFQTSNPSFNDCLGHKFKKVTQPVLKDQKVSNLQQLEDLQTQQIIEQSCAIYPHKEFSQIEKDIDRTCQLSIDKKKTFERILKRITNHFPAMGYTQGINFIIGYLLTVGYEQFDVFWMFIHIAIGRRYLLLGLFEDHFPLSNIYKIRTNTPLFEHLYNQLQMDESVWVSKWFFTYFIYSFPHQMIKYVFDVVIQTGGLGLIKFAVAITHQLTSILMNQHDVCQISIFFQSLRKIQVFNEHISMNRVIQRVYNLEVLKEDFVGINSNPNSFYAKFILASLQKQNYHHTVKIFKPETQNHELDTRQKLEIITTEDISRNLNSEQLLQIWYQKLITERLQFMQKNAHKVNDQVNQLKQDKIKQKQEVLNELHVLICETEEQDNKSPEKEKSTHSYKNSIKDSIQMKKQSVPSTGCSFDKKESRMINRDNVSNIDEIWQEQEKNSSISKNFSSKISQQSRTQNGFNPKIKKNQYQDQLDKFASTQANPIGKSKNNGYNNKVSSIFKQQKLSSLKPKINNFQISQNKSRGSLAKAAQQILSNFSINEISHHQSSNSDYSKISQKQKKSKQNDLYGKNYYKNKMTKHVSLQNQIENKKDINTEKSLRFQESSSKDSHTDLHNSFQVSNQSIQDKIKNDELEACSVKDFDTYRERVSTHQNILTISLHASDLKENKTKYGVQSNVSEIEIFQAPQIFKKKKRVSSRINGAENQIFFAEDVKQNKLSHTISQVEIAQKREKSRKIIKMGIEQCSIYEESYESLFVPSEAQKSNSYRFREELQNYQVESVK